MMIKKERYKFVLAILLALSITGCGGEFSYKRGANISDFQTSKASCVSEEKSEKEIDACLAENGWLVVDINKPLSPEPIPAHQDAKSPLEEVKTNTDDPLAQLAIGAWFKLGASQNQLILDSKQCVADLGELHQTQNNLSLVTRGFLSCMSDLGWHGLIQ